MALRRAWALRSLRVAAVAATLTGLGLLSSPLTGVHGVEAALVLGVALPPFAAAAACRFVLDLRADGVALTPRRALGGVLVLAMFIWAIPVGILALNGLRVAQCTPFEGLAFMALGPGFSLALTVITAALVGTLVSRPRLATTIAVLVPIAAVAYGVWAFWSTPAIFVFSHYGGWFPGTIYDVGISIPSRLLSFRALTLVSSLGLGVLFAAAVDPATGRFRVARLSGRPALTGLALLLFGGALAGEMYGLELGHRTSAEHMAEELGISREGKRCMVHAPREIDRGELGRLVADCDFRIEQAEARFAVRHEGRVHAFFFRNAEEKQWLMGAARTYIAKPWRSEVYLQHRGWPHPVLAHEIVHVVAGAVAEGPFRVGGQFGGFLPDPALIEGVAVGVAWDQRGGLTPHQWSKAMVELDLMPPLDQVVGLSFLGQPSSNAYTITGSFVHHLIETYGAEPMTEAYRTGDIAAAFGKPLSELEAEWRSMLNEVELPDEALELARLRFTRPSIFSAVCPHRLARLRDELAADLGARDDARAVETCREILEIDPNHAVTRAELVGAYARLRERERAMSELLVLASPPRAPEPVLVAARGRLADAAWQRGEPNEAERIYLDLLGEAQDDSAARQLEVKVSALQGGGIEADLVRDLLIGADGVAATAAEAVHLARELRAQRGDGLGAYLEARQLMFALNFERALDVLGEAGQRGVPSERVFQEARRMHGHILVATGQLDGAEEVWTEVRTDPDSSMSNRAAAQDWLERIAWLRRNPPD